jgi:tetratricopeptide (TPR) repeat protein
LQVAARSTDQAGKIEYFKIPANAQIQDTSEFFTDDGSTVRLLNNEGYSYMLRGDLKRARAKFQSALRLDPNNQTTLNNIKLLDDSTKFIERSANGEPCASVDCSQ